MHFVVKTNLSKCVFTLFPLNHENWLLARRPKYAETSCLGKIRRLHKSGLGEGMNDREKLFYDETIIRGNLLQFHFELPTYTNAKYVRRAASRVDRKLN